MALKPTELRRRWRAQEKRSAKRNSGRNPAGSGNSWRAPGDVITGKTLISCKRTDGASIAITDSHLKKHTEDAMMEDKTPMWELEIGGKTYYMFCACDVVLDGEGGVAVNI